jgi:hypothetical protein
MEILALVAVLVVAASGLYVAATFNTRTRRNTAPMIDDAAKHVSDKIEASGMDLRKQLLVISDELQRDRERLDQAESRNSRIASEFSAELEAIKRQGEQIGARQDQFSSGLQQLDHQVGQLGESLVRRGGGEQQADETLRYLKGQCPESVPVGEPFSLLVSIVTTGPASAGLKPFNVPPGGRDVLLVVHAPRLQLLGQQRATVHVPSDGDSEPVMFELRADAPGPQRVSVTAWLGGSYLGDLLVEVTAERDGPSGTNRDVLAEIATEGVSGAVSLVVRYDPVQETYRFEFRDEDYPEEVTSHLAYEPGPRVERLLAEMDELAKGRSGYSAAEARDYLVNTGAGLWRELVPERLREQFWERQHRIRQLTILADKDTVQVS